MELELALNSLVSLEHPSSCFHHPSAGIPNVHHQEQFVLVLGIGPKARYTLVNNPTN